MTVYATSTVVSTATFYTAAGVATDMTTITCTVTVPAGTSTVYTYGTSAELTKPTGTGIYACTVDATTAGDYTFRWYGVDASGNKVTNIDYLSVLT